MCRYGYTVALELAFKSHTELLTALTGASEVTINCAAQKQLAKVSSQHNPNTGTLRLTAATQVRVRI